MAQEQFHDEFMVSSALSDLIIVGSEEITEILAENGISATDAISFAEAGVLTRNAGFVLTLADGAEYQVTVVCSR